MTKLYLITGFLGAGKTTFLHQFVRLFPDRRTAIVVNEFGKQGVDGTLLEDLDIKMEEINNGSIFCACKIEQFEDALLRLQKENFDVIFVEASGLSDPTAVGTILRQRDKFPDLEYAGAICLVDGARFMTVYKTARVCRMQLAISNMIIINKCDIASREQLDEINTIVRAQKPNRPTFETMFGRIRPGMADSDGRTARRGSCRRTGPHERYHAPQAPAARFGLQQKGPDVLSSDVCRGNVSDQGLCKYAGGTVCG